MKQPKGKVNERMSIRHAGNRRQKKQCDRLQWALEKRVSDAETVASTNIIPASIRYLETPIDVSILQVWCVVVSLCFDGETRKRERHGNGLSKRTLANQQVYPSAAAIQTTDITYARIATDEKNGQTRKANSLQHLMNQFCGSKAAHIKSLSDSLSAT